jgi:hypothetical protein
LHYSLFSLTAVALALVAPVASADTTAFGTRTGDATPAAAHKSTRTRKSSSVSVESGTEATSTSPLAAELQRLNTQRKNLIVRRLASRNAADIAALDKIKAKTDNIDLLAKISEAKQLVKESSHLRSSTPSKLRKLSTAETEFFKIKVSRDRAIEFTQSAVYKEAKPYYENLLKKALSDEDFDIAKKIKFEITDMAPIDKSIVIGKWRLGQGDEVWQFKPDYTCEASKGSKVNWISSYRIVKVTGKMGIILGGRSEKEVSFLSEDRRKIEEGKSYLTKISN